MPTFESAATVDHIVKVNVTENVTHKMYLRQEIGQGTTDDGQKITIDSTGAHIIVSVGEFRKAGARQFIVSVSDIAAAIVDSLTNFGPRVDALPKSSGVPPQAR